MPREEVENHKLQHISGDESDVLLTLGARQTEFKTLAPAGSRHPPGPRVSADARSPRTRPGPVSRGPNRWRLRARRCAGERPGDKPTHTPRPCRGRTAAGVSGQRCGQGQPTRAPSHPHYKSHNAPRAPRRPGGDFHPAAASPGACAQLYMAPRWLTQRPVVPAR